MIAGIVAIAENYAIGKDGKLPWHYSADLKHFKKTTIGNAVVMGASTWRSIGKPLPGRTNIVLSRTLDLRQSDVAVVRNKQEVFAIQENLDGDIFIIGGAETFKTFQRDIQKWIVTRVPLTVADADVFMPKNFLDGFVLTEQNDLGEEL